MSPVFVSPLQNSFLFVNISLFFIEIIFIFLLISFNRVINLFSRVNSTLFISNLFSYFCFLPISSVIMRLIEPLRFRLIRGTLLHLWSKILKSVFIAGCAFKPIDGGLFELVHFLIIDSLRIALSPQLLHSLLNFRHHLLYR